MIKLPASITLLPRLFRAHCAHDPDRYAMKNVENLIILKRYYEDLVELTSSDVQEGNEA